ncbi:hypothetical protein ABE545_09020 [Sphingobacterium faecium]|uniref:dCTP deaminase n=1 Tax=Sphingobacterium faecium TaxID=34087 RepID=UPI003208C748
MLIIDDNLKSLMIQHLIVENPEKNFDNNSISLSLDNTIIRFIGNETNEIIYGDDFPEELYIQEELKSSEYLILKPKEGVLACSKEFVKMPLGYFGLLQTKGSLARLLVTIHCCDSQIDPGFEGKITFEIINLSNYTIKILPGKFIGALYLIKTSSEGIAYNGKYNNSLIPTIQK